MRFRPCNCSYKVSVNNFNMVNNINFPPSEFDYDDRIASSGTPSDNFMTVQPQNIFFAVKTCNRFHNERVPIIKATWGQIVTHIRYYSDVMDPEIPTTYTGVPNTEIGHCEKTLKILKLAFQEINEFNMRLENGVPELEERINWLVLADDDTLLSIPNLCELLGCFNHTHDIYLGERYGFHINSGFNYITSGGGVALSLSAVEKLIAYCHCSRPQDADDMLLGICFSNLEVPVIHSPQFHQLRPQDYPVELLSLDPPISFHKFYDVDPLAVYEQYFSVADQRMLQKIKDTDFK